MKQGALGFHNGVPRPRGWAGGHGGAGRTIHAEAVITADCDLSLSEAHAVAEGARHAMVQAVPKRNPNPWC